MSLILDIPKIGDVAVEVMWFPQDHIAELSGEELRELADRYAASLIVDWKARQKLSIGLDDRQDVSSSVASLALMAIEHFPANWVGLFELKGGFWLCAANNGHPYPLADRWFEAEQEGLAVEALTEIRQLLDLSNVYAPAYMKVDGSEEKNLSDLAEPSSSMMLRSPEPTLLAKVQDFSREHSKAIRLALVFAVLSAVGYMAYDSYRVSLIKEQNKEEQRLAQLENERQKELKRQEKENEFKQLWEQLPKPSSHLATCKYLSRKLSSPIAGWKNSPAVCSNSSVTIKKTRDWGLVSRLQQKASGYGFDVVSLNDGGFSLSVLWNQPERRGPQELRSLNTSRSELQDWAYTIGASVSFKTSESAGTLAKTQQDVFRTTLVVHSIYQLDSFYQIADRIAGLGVTEAKKIDGRWSIEGVIYHVD